MSFSLHNIWNNFLTCSFILTPTQKLKRGDRVFVGFFFRHCFVFFTFFLSLTRRTRKGEGGGHQEVVTHIELVFSLTQRNDRRRQKEKKRTEDRKERRGPKIQGKEEEEEKKRRWSAEETFSFVSFMSERTLDSLKSSSSCVFLIVFLTLASFFSCRVIRISFFSLLMDLSFLYFSKFIFCPTLSFFHSSNWPV